ncbi:NUDIX domain-containing protein [Candidatus Parcubacteria bacterium]|nr:MAG: NUDIX domain-containing protein [Candidatus Parcubacteria bacterium]
MQENRPLVGLGVMVIKYRKVLIGKRKGAHGEGCYAFPGGHLEFMEEYKECAEREVLEETGMKVEYRPLYPFFPEAFITNNLMKEDVKHYITIFVVSDWISGEPQLLEPEKNEGWKWVGFDELMDLVPPEAFRNYEHPQNHWVPTGQMIRKRIEIGL